MIKPVAIHVLIVSSALLAFAGVSSTGWINAKGPANSDRPKRSLLDDITADENFERTEGLDLIWKLQADPANVVLSSVTAELRGLKYYDTEYRWPAVYGRLARPESSMGVALVRRLTNHALRKASGRATRPRNRNTPEGSAIPRRVPSITLSGGCIPKSPLRAASRRR
jgi:hypothetical protein